MPHVLVINIEVFQYTPFSQRASLHPKGHCHHCLALFLPFCIFDKWSLEFTLYINYFFSYLSYPISCFSILRSPSNALLTLGISVSSLFTQKLFPFCLVFFFFYCLPEGCPSVSATSQSVARLWGPQSSFGAVDTFSTVPRPLPAFPHYSHCLLFLASSASHSSPLRMLT